MAVYPVSRPLVGELSISFPDGVVNADRKRPLLDELAGDDGSQAGAVRRRTGHPLALSPWERGEKNIAIGDHHG